MQEIPQTNVPNENIDHLSPQPNVAEIEVGAQIPNETPLTEKNNKWLMIGGVVALIFILLGGVFAYQQYTSPQAVSLDDSNMAGDIPKVDVVSNNSDMQDEGEEQTIIEMDDQISDWKTYSDSKYGYSIKYPQDSFKQIKCPGDEVDKFMLTIDSSNRSVIDASTCARDTIYNLELTPSPKTINDLYIDNYDVIESNITVDGISGKKYVLTQIESQPGSSWYIFAQFDKEDRGFNLYFQGECNGVTGGKTHAECEEMFDQIISTFEFVEEDLTESISDEEIILVRVKEAYEKQFPERSQFFDETKIPSNELKIEGEWAFGIIYPPRDLSLYVAHKSNGEWEIAVEDVVKGNEMYDNWFQQLPNSIVSQ
jgi:hypothetical protein